LPPRGIADGSLVEGLVTAKDADMYQVRIGSQLLNARSTIQLFVGQRFRAVWDASTSPPMLRLQQSDMAVLAHFTGRDREVALALLGRGMPLDDETVQTLRRAWIQNGGDPAKLGAAAELLARGVELTFDNITLLAWYMELTRERVASIWKKIRERLREKKYSSPRDLVGALQEDEDEQVRRFLRAHALVGRPAKDGLEPTMMLASAWWPVSDDENSPVMARVSFSQESSRGRRVWWLAFEFAGRLLGTVAGDVVSDEKALSVNIRLGDERAASVVRGYLPALREALGGSSLRVQHVGVGVAARPDAGETPKNGLDMEV
jgi:hypothetical protein